MVIKHLLVRENRGFVKCKQDSGKQRFTIYLANKGSSVVAVHY